MYPEFRYKEEGAPHNWNVVLMTHKEHFVAHHLLYEIYGRSGPMARAFKMNSITRDVRVFCTSFNLKQLESWNYKVSDDTRRRISESKRGTKLSEEGRRNISLARLGNQNAKGFKHSEETRARVS